MTTYIVDPVELAEARAGIRKHRIYIAPRTAKVYERCLVCTAHIRLNSRVLFIGPKAFCWDCAEVIRNVSTGLLLELDELGRGTAP